MRLDHHKSEHANAQVSAKRWMSVAFVLLGANLLLSMFVAGKDTRVQTIVMPASLEKSFWVKGQDVAPAYLEELSRYFGGLMLNVTPKNVDAAIDILLRHVAPLDAGRVRAEMTVQATRLKRDGVSTAFYPVEYHVKLKERQVVMAGDLITLVGSRLTSTQPRAWRFSYTYLNDRFYLTEFVEVSRDRMFEPAENSGDRVAADSGK